MGTDLGCRAGHPEWTRDERVIEVSRLDGFQGSEPTPAAGFFPPQGEPTWGVESVSRGRDGTPGHPRCLPALCQSLALRPTRSLALTRGRGKQEALFAELIGVWLPWPSRKPRALGQETEEDGTEPLSSVAKWGTKRNMNFYLWVPHPIRSLPPSWAVGANPALPADGTVVGIR